MFVPFVLCRLAKVLGLAIAPVVFQGKEWMCPKKADAHMPSSECWHLLVFIFCRELRGIVCSRVISLLGSR
jgi:hypothetical protein